MVRCDSTAITITPHLGNLPVPSISIQSMDETPQPEWFFDVFPPYEQRSARQYTLDAPDNQGLVLYLTEECCPGDAYQVDVVSSNNNGAQQTFTTAGGQFGDCQAVPTNGWDACTRNTDFATATYTSGVYSRLALLLPAGASYIVTVSVYRDRTPESSNPFFVGVALADCNVPRIVQLPEGSYGGSIVCPAVWKLVVVGFIRHHLTSHSAPSTPSAP